MSYTPMIEQYLKMKEQYKDCILFFRLGDFYEMFFEDAVIACRDMDVVLTHKACGNNEKAPMCGVPYHAAETYIARLLEKGHKVAIAEQMSDPALTKGLVEREVIKIITPGTVMSESMLDEKSNNFLMSIYLASDGAGVSWCDISTGDFNAVKYTGDSYSDELSAHIEKISPSEIITNLDKDECPSLWEQCTSANRIYISKPDPIYFSDRCCEDILKRHLRLNNLSALGISNEDDPLIFYSTGAILGYIYDTQKQDVIHLGDLKIENNTDYMSLDKATIKNLELTETLFDRNVRGSLLGVLDKTGTAMGSRTMKMWLRQPLNDLREIKNRLDAVETLVNDILLRNNLREALKSIYDLERLCGRISLGTANARDMIALKNSLNVLPEIKSDLQGSGNEMLMRLSEDIDIMEALCKKIDEAIVDDPPFSIREGGFIRKSYSKELDDIKFASKDATAWIAALENKEKERTGIRTLKVGYNKVFGYYIEVSNSFKNQVPPEYIRKQTLVGGERYITPEMKEMENIVLNAQSKINDIEYRLFVELRDYAKSLSSVIQRTSHAIAAADVLCSFADSSAGLGYIKPEVNDSDEIIIKNGRHPVIENAVKDGIFVSNDVYINKSDASMLLITGPNMAGKSTYMRQLALIVLMAQTGCFVPADSAMIGICDKIYTRIGASDNIGMGQSTFFVEMSELAYILNTATENSLVILDEIGRGTSTYDGLSIAWAVVDYLTRPEKKIRTMFATHYHELTVLQETNRSVKNLNVAVSEDDGNIVFLHKIIEGAASRSYGIHVAKLAGVPSEILSIASTKLSELENDSKSIINQSGGQEQLSLFNFSDSVIAQRLKNLDLMNITPSKAIEVLEDLKKETQ